MDLGLLLKLKESLLAACSKETSSDPEHWSPENPLWGHCAVAALIAQNFFGGTIVRVSLEYLPEFTHLRSHYFNKLPDGAWLDLTRRQFPEGLSITETPKKRPREYVLSSAETKKRYELLAFRVARAFSGNNPIFDDPIYRVCFMEALQSPCQKKKFGCVITHRGKIVQVVCNDTIEPLKALCEGGCIRLNIPSRSEPMLGACGHAEELALWAVVHKGIPLEQCELYVAGLNDKCLPWLKTEKEHTCLRCAVQQYHAGLMAVHVPVIDQWVSMTAEEALISARDYALRLRNGGE